jgi:hypothetical protein
MNGFSKCVGFNYESKLLYFPSQEELWAHYLQEVLNCQETFNFRDPVRLYSRERRIPVRNLNLEVNWADFVTVKNPFIILFNLFPYIII